MKTDTGDLALLVFERRSAAAAHHHAHPVWWLRTLLAWIPAQRGCFRKWAGRALSLVIDIQARIPSSINIRSSIGSGIDVTHFSGVDYLDSVDPGREGDPGEVGGDVESVEWWWSELSASERVRACALSPHESLPDDLVVTLLLYGVALDTATDPHAIPQPSSVAKFLRREQQRRPHQPAPRVTFSAARRCSRPGRPASVGSSRRGGVDLLKREPP
ncbi:hypothetical protein OG218_01315 [Kineococcus sp. NBC_00420]|uniref:hypothetical protein n=1 Tax=Kineococcus sp. NBC_00420 TaxID=2903564 RepID=UPI002E21CE9D